MTRPNRSGSKPKSGVVEKGAEKSAPSRVRICEGVREEIERLGKAVDPFTGKTLTRDDLEPKVLRKDPGSDLKERG